MVLSIPDDFFRSLDMSEEALLLELAVALYAANKISFGLARRLTNLDWYRFREILTARNIPAHYGIKEFEEDLANLTSFASVK
jgi:predicted HTH domain antitoxin